MSPRIRIVSALGAAVLVLGGGALVLRGGSPFAGWTRAQEASEAAATGGPSIGGPFTLMAEDGRSVTDEAYRGKWMLVYFGYTFCPDVCPTTLNNIAQALAQLGPDAERLNPLFITVDPKRDTPKVMGDYVKSFDPQIIGLSGTPGQIAAVAKEYHVYYAVQPGDGDNYLVDHSSFVYLMTPQGAFAKVIPGSTEGKAMAEAIKPLVDSTS